MTVQISKPIDARAQLTDWVTASIEHLLAYGDIDVRDVTESLTAMIHAARPFLILGDYAGIEDAVARGVNRSLRRHGMSEMADRSAG